jgi:thioredoxin 1
MDALRLSRHPYVSVETHPNTPNNRCGPCKFIGPIFEKLAAENPEAEFVKVDVDEADDVAAACAIQAMPTFQFYKGGAKIDEMKGADKAGLEQMIAKNK